MSEPRSGKPHESEFTSSRESLSALTPEDGPSEDIASEEYWVQTVPGLTRANLARFGTQASVEFSQGRVKRLWTRSQIEAVQRQLEGRHRGGLYTDPETKQIAATTYAWQQEFDVGSNLIARRLEAIGAQLQSPPPDACYPDRPLYTSHTVLAGLEHSQNLRQSASVLVPDPARQTVVGSIAAWSTSLAKETHTVGEALVAADQHPIDLVGRSRAKIFTYEQVLDALPQAFNQPHLQVRQPGVMIEPSTRQRYVVATEAGWRRQLKQWQVAGLTVLDTNGRPATYYTEEAIRSVGYAPEPRGPVTWNEYFAAAAVYNPAHFHKETLASLLDQAHFAPTYEVRALDEYGYLTLGQRRLVPRSVLLDVLQHEPDATRQAQLSQRISALTPITVQDVYWPGHWSGAARLWLYDPTPLNREALSGQKLTLQGRDHEPASTSTPQTMAPRDETSPRRYTVRVTRPEEAASRADTSALTTIRQSIEQMQTGYASEPEKRRRRFQERLAELQALPDLPKHLSFLASSLHRFLNVEGHKLAEPLQWIMEYARAIPGLVLPLNVEQAKEQKVQHHLSRDGHMYLAEKEVVRIICDVSARRP